MMPEEERVQYSAMTGQSLFYMGETDLKHKILAIVEEEGAERPAMPEALQSGRRADHRLYRQGPGDRQAGDAEYRVEGPVMIFLTTTAIDIDEELLNRCLVLTVERERASRRARSTRCSASGRHSRACCANAESEHAS